MRIAGCLPALLLLFSGCARPIAGYYPQWNKSRIERLALFENIETIAVAPVLTGGGVAAEEARYTAMFERALFNRLLGLRRFRVAPNEEFEHALAAAAEKGARDAAATRTFYNEQVLLEAATAVKADAVLALKLEDLDPYLLPRVVLIARVYLARRPAASYQAILDMTDDGVPTGVPQMLRDRFIWQQDLVLDAHDASVLEMVGAFARTQGVQYHGFGAEIFVRSMARFMDFAAAVLAKRLFDDAEFYRVLKRYEYYEKISREHRTDSSVPPAGAEHRREF